MRRSSQVSCKLLFEIFYGFHRFASQALLEWARHLSMQASLKGLLGCTRSFATTDFRWELAAFKVPTLVTHGTNDQIVPIETLSHFTSKGRVLDFV
jgi:non-heme chloroperoxidase